MSSLVAWLDATAEEQRRVREIVQAFSERETQDELGGRRIVIALSDVLFPGTSVLHSRARYLLFIPWFAKLAANKKDPVGWFDWYQRRMIARFLEDDTLPDEDRTKGLIGSRAGPGVKQLPSTAYWTALEAWGILAVSGTVAQTLHRTRQGGANPAEDGADELAHRSFRVWHPGVGEAPAGFLDETLDGGFALRRDEAIWLREQWLSEADGSLLAHLARAGQPLMGQGAPWEEPACLNAASEILEVLDQAERFSLASVGASWLYHLMLAERYQECGFDRLRLDFGEIRDALNDWAENVGDRSDLFTGWHPEGFWELVKRKNSNIDDWTWEFFNVWFERMRRGDLGGIADDASLRDGIAKRERSLKKMQARLLNPKLLGAWQGTPPGRVVYRWPQVSQLVSDVSLGIGDADS